MKHIRFEDQTISPSKIICVGRNYAEHIKELGNETPDEMVLFLKPNSAISSELISFHEEPLHYELEIVLLVIDGQYAGVGMGIDLTKRALQSRLKKAGLPWERAKAFDRSAVFTQFVSMSGLDESLEFMHYTLHIDDLLVQHGYVSHMLHKPQAILDECHAFVTLNDGDLIMTGTPKGVGEIKKGARFNARLYSASDVNEPLIDATWQVAE